MGRKKITFFLVLVCLCLLPGCWDYREINNLAVVVGCAVDKNEKGDYVLTVEIINPRPKGTESELKPIVVSMEGKSIFDAVRNLICRVGQPLFWSHTKVVIIGDKMAREGVMPILDWLYRDRETRPDIWLLVAKDKKGAEIFKGNPETSQAVSLQLDQTLLVQQQIGEFSRVELWRFIELLSMPGFSPFMPTVNLVEVQDKKIPQIYGTAIFKNDQLKGWINGYESKLLQWIYGDSTAGALFKPEKDHQSDPSITYEILKNKVKIEPVKEGQEIIMKLKIEVTLSLEQLSKTAPKYYEEHTSMQLERQIESMLSSQVQSLISKVQDKYGCDIFGFGSLLHQTMPKEWHKYANDWETKFKTLQTRTNVHAHVMESTMMYQPIKVRD